eukprot:Plantae.Rhodophyta-Rhodochaete_pulchella.ctg6312.p1 GENE.Plantae.Rhodophyta-Rhodochaete_pulchella.ctg6312~~Plantae.Rhodophyta-Rhodochaete_pulchella.ctg6312.p1  ORF type:complete len:138 (-),score=10.37 Plantae.Rhodophyta-Rhodochaete_pulchella.ctg6312:619-1032(-)
MVKSVFILRKGHTLPSMTSILLRMVRDKSVELTFAVRRYPYKRRTARAREMPAGYTVDKITPVVWMIQGDGGVYLVSRDSCGCLHFHKEGYCKHLLYFMEETGTVSAHFEDSLNAAATLQPFNEVAHVMLFRQSRAK